MSTFKLSLPAPEELPPTVAAKLRGMPPLNVLWMLGRTGWLEVVAATLTQMFDGTQFPAVDRETMILRIAAHTKVGYPLAQHRFFSRSVGMSDALIDAVIARDFNSLDQWTTELCLISEEITDRVVLSEESVAKLVAHYGQDGTAKAIWMMGWFNMLVRFVGSTRLPVEKNFGQPKMNQFTARVELSGSPSPEDCARFDEAMRKEDFRATTGWRADGSVSRAEYSRESELDQNAVRDSAVRAAHTVGRDFSVSVNKTDAPQKDQLLAAFASTRFLPKRNPE